MATDTIGDRFKSQYENRTRYSLPRRTYTIVRVDGKAFHTYTRHRAKPFDETLEASMDAAALAFCSEAHGIRFGYGQSDEYPFLLTDFETPLSQAWFDGNIQKICSVGASIFTLAFNDAECNTEHGAMFDCRVFTIPDPIEVENYFIWRQQDAVRNSIQSLGQAHFSPKQLHGVNTTEIQEILFKEKGINWNDLPPNQKRGRAVVKETYTLDGTERSRWVVDRNNPTFTQDRNYLIDRIPQLETRIAVAQ